MSKLKYIENLKKRGILHGSELDSSKPDYGWSIWLKLDGSPVVSIVVMDTQSAHFGSMIIIMSGSFERYELNPFREVYGWQQFTILSVAEAKNILGHSSDDIGAIKYDAASDRWVYEVDGAILGQVNHAEGSWEAVLTGSSPISNENQANIERIRSNINWYMGMSDYEYRTVINEGGWYNWVVGPRLTDRQVKVDTLDQTVNPNAEFEMTTPGPLRFGIFRFMKGKPVKIPDYPGATYSFSNLMFTGVNLGIRDVKIGGVDQFVLFVGTSIPDGSMAKERRIVIPLHSALTIKKTGLFDLDYYQRGKRDAQNWPKTHTSADSGIAALKERVLKTLYIGASYGIWEPSGDGRLLWKPHGLYRNTLLDSLLEPTFALFDLWGKMIQDPKDSISQDELAALTQKWVNESLSVPDRNGLGVLRIPSLYGTFGLTEEK